MTSAVLAAMRREIAGESPLFARRLAGSVPDQPGFSLLFDAAGGGRGKSAADNHFALEFIFEGYLLHYAGSRLLADDGSDEFHLLAGDYMYARGLNRIAAGGDLAVIRALAALIEACADIHARGGSRDKALDAWTAVTLCLADRSGGGDALEEGSIVSLERLLRSLATGEETRELGRRLLARAPGGGEPARAVLLDIYECYAPGQEVQWRSTT